MSEPQNLLSGRAAARLPAKPDKEDPPMRIAPSLRAAASTLALTVLVGAFALTAAAAECDTKTMQLSAGSSVNPNPGANVPAGAASERQQMANSGLDPNPGANIPAGAASERRQVANSGLDPNPGANIPAGAASERQQLAYSSTKDAQGNTLNPSTGTTVPGTPSFGAASERSQTAMAPQGCK
jgi:hypothetical protein